MLSLKMVLQNIFNKTKIDLPGEDTAYAALPMLTVPELAEKKNYGMLLARENFLAIEENQPVEDASIVIQPFELEKFFIPETGFEDTGARLLGSGEHGRAWLYKFKLHNLPEHELTPEECAIKKLCEKLIDKDDKEGLIVIKREVDKQGNGVGIVQDEQNMANYLAHKTGNFVQARPAVIINEHKKPEAVILSKYACFDQNLQAEKPKARNKSYSVKAFLEKMQDVATGRQRFKQKKIHVAVPTEDGAQKLEERVIEVPHKVGKAAHKAYTQLANNFDVIFVQLFSAEMAAIQAMHDAGIYHLDIAARNFLMDRVQYNENGEIVKLNVLAADFGEAAVYDQKTGFSYKKNNQYDKLPIRAMDIETLSKTKEHYTIRNDIYAAKIFLLNQLAMDLGYEETAPIFIRAGESLAYNFYNRATYCNNKDAEVLKVYLGNLKELAGRRRNFIEQKKTDLQNIKLLIAQRKTEVKTCVLELARLRATWRANNTETQNYIKEIDQRLNAYYKQRQQNKKLLGQTEQIKRQLDKKVNSLLNNGRLTTERALNTFKQQLIEADEKIALLQTEQEALTESIKLESIDRQARVEYYKWNKFLDRFIDPGVELAAEELRTGKYKAVHPVWIDAFDELEQKIDEQNALIIAHEEAATERVDLCIKSYADYITQTPWDSANATEHADIRKIDYEFYLTGNERAFLNLIGKKLNYFIDDFSAQAQAFRLVAEQLLAITVSAEFKQLPLYQQLLAYVNAKNAQAINLEKLRQDWQAAYEKMPRVNKSEDWIEQLPPEIVSADEPTTVTQLPELQTREKNKRLHQAELKALEHKLTALNDVFKEKTRYYHKAFYSMLNPLRHRFIKTRQEIFVNLPAIVELMRDDAAYFNANVDLLRLFNADNKAVYKQEMLTANVEIKQQLRKIEFILRSLRKKFANYQNYILLVMENFEERFARLTEEDSSKFVQLAQELAAFKKILLSPELAQSYQPWLSLLQEDRLARADRLTETLQQKITSLLTAGNNSELQKPDLTVKSLSIEKSQPVKALQAGKMASPEKSLKEWQKFYSREEGWKCKKIKNNNHALIVYPKAKLNFIADISDNSFVYQRNMKLAADKKINLPVEEEKLIAAIITAFIKTGCKKAEISGGEALCAQALRQLKNYPAIEEVKINDKVVYSIAPGAENAAMENFKSSLN